MLHGLLQQEDIALLDFPRRSDSFFKQQLIEALCKISLMEKC